MSLVVVVAPRMRLLRLIVLAVLAATRAKLRAIHQKARGQKIFFFSPSAVGVGWLAVAVVALSLPLSLSEREESGVSSLSLPSESDVTAAVNQLKMGRAGDSTAVHKHQTLAK